jgi:hypothetical protein
MTNTAQHLIRPIRKFDALSEFYQISAPLIGYAVQQLGWTATAYCDQRGFFSLSRAYGNHTVETFQICFHHDGDKFGTMKSCDRIIVNIDTNDNPVSNLRIESSESLWHHLNLANGDKYSLEPAPWFTNLIGGE